MQCYMSRQSSKIMNDHGFSQRGQRDTWLLPSHSQIFTCILKISSVFLYDDFSNFRIWSCRFYSMPGSKSLTIFFFWKMLPQMSLQVSLMILLQIALVTAPAISAKFC